MYNDTSQSSLELTLLPWQSLIEGGGGEATLCTTIETLSLRADKATPFTPNYAWATCLTLHDPDTISISISISISITLPIFIPNSLSIALPICMSLYMPLSSCSAQCPCPFPSLFPFALSCIPSHDLLLHIISLLHSVRVCVRICVCVCVCLLMRP